MSKHKRLAAKKKLKSQMEKTASAMDFTPTVNMCWYWWRVINKAVFKSELPPPDDIVLKKLRGSWGRCDTWVRGKCVINISSDIPDRKFLIATIAHEMVHQWQHVTDSHLGHGAKFKEWDEFFKRTYKMKI